MKLDTGYVHKPPAKGLSRVTIPRYVFNGEPKDNYQFRNSMNKWLREHCWRAEYEYPDDVCIYPHAVWIDKEIELVFKLTWAV
jgi:hypothetical protein